MVSVARIIPPPSARREAVHYHVFMTSVLMSRFGQLAKLVAFACWALTTALGLFSHIGWIWWLLPIRAIVVFIAAFILLIYRKSYLRVSNKPFANLASALIRQLSSSEFASALAVYGASAHLFFILVKSQYHTPVTVQFKAYEPYTLNEQYIYLNSFATYAAVLYAVIFIVLDYDLVRFPLIPSRTQHIQRVVTELSSNAILAFIYSAFATLSYPLVYLLIRRPLWTTSLSFFRVFTKLHRSNAYVEFPVGFKMLCITFLASFLLFALWEFVNSSFRIYMSLGPMHRGSTISDKSEDSNGTLVTGLQATPREYCHTMAFQELCLISMENRDRRVAIYKDIQRDPEPTVWKQVCKESLKVLDTVCKKLEKKKVEPVVEAKKDVTVRQENVKSVLSVKHDNIFATPDSPREQQARRIVENLQDKNAQQSANAISALESLVALVHKQIEKYSALATKILATPVGYPFRCTLERKSVSVIPNPAIVHCALMSLRQFVCKSTTEDEFGIVHRDINDILSNLNRLITLTEAFLKEPPLHWTDVLAISGEHVPNVTRMVQAYESAVETFESIVDTFADQIGQLGLSPDVLQRASAYANQLERVY